jgi:mannose-1-phosphate guanylyltransferase
MLHAVVMAGGSGTRFWPLSRAARPKQFLPLTGAAPLIVETVKRLPPSRTWVVCGKAHAAAAKKLLKKVTVLVEPQARNTAPAIALATAHVAHQAGPDAVIAVLPSDQHVADVPAFRAALATAAKVAERGFIVTLGITPTRPDTGYGYIRLGEALGEARRVQKFVEKPDLSTAQGYLATGEYVWNAGMFVFRAGVMLAAFEKHMPDLYAPLKELQATLGTRRYAKALVKLFPKMPATSIDYGVAERADNIAVVPGSFGWSDVGSFNALPEVRAVDGAGNVTEGLSFAIDSSGCVVLGQKRPVAVVGMKDTVVVDAGDAVLVLPKDKSQDVRKVVERLKADHLQKYL